MFYKLQGNEMVFQLANLEVKEDFKLWDNNVGVFVSRIDGVQNIDDLKFMKHDLFKQRYPHLRKATQYVRDIIIPQGNLRTQYAFGFKPTANDQLNNCIQSCRNLGINPLEVEYTLRKTGSGLNTTYAVISGQRVGIPQNVVQSSMPDQATNPQETPITLEEANSQYNVVPIGNVAKIAPNAATGASGKGFALPPKPEVETPTPEEMSVIRWANDHTEKMDEATFISGFVYTLKQEFNQTITDARARKWYYQFYAKK